MFTRLLQIPYVTAFFSRQFIKFAFVGLLNTAVTYLSFCLFLWLDMHYTIAAFIGYGIGVVNSYVWNKRWTFRSTNPVGREFTKFIFIYLLAFSINLLVIVIAVDFFYSKPQLGEVYGIALASIVSYLGHRNWSFK